MKRAAFIMTLVAVSLIAGRQVLGEASISIDNVSPTLGPGVIPADSTVRFTFRGIWNPEGDTTIDGQVLNDGWSIASFTSGFQVYEKNGGPFFPIAFDTLPVPSIGGWTGAFNLIFSINSFGVDGIGADTLGFGGVSLSIGIPDGFNEQIWYIETGSAQSGDSICLDSSWYPPANSFIWVQKEPPPGTSQSPLKPDWLGPFCYRVQAEGIGSLIVDPDSLYFSGVEGGSPPPLQAFTLSSTADPIDFEIVETIPWAQLSPIIGTTVRTITVQINTTGLTAGTYVDSARIDADNADNTPRYVKLVLELEPPPPVIGTDPDEFFFNAIAGDTNPDPKSLTITNVGGSTLNWTVSNTESWLNLTPLAGVDSGDVEVAVDITGLAFNTYYDTIVVSDTNATNDPQRVPVTLNVASDLPVIAVDSAFNLIVWKSTDVFGPPRDLVVRNAGAGVMNFWIVENSIKIQSVTPSSGTAPETLTVQFKGPGASGTELDDTLWVYSNEAINSPFPVTFRYHFESDPANLFLSRDTVTLNSYECGLGYGVFPPSQTLFVNNVGGDDPMAFEIVYESDFFTVTPESGEADDFVIVSALDVDFPLGTYYDTLVVIAPYAINSPETVIVCLNVNPGDTPPQIFLLKNHYTFPTQENAGPTPGSALAIYNKFGGCMPWSIQENVPWLTAVPDSGDVPQGTTLGVNAAGYLFGEYYDSLFVVAPTATNSPRKVILLLQVWRFHGDWDYSGEINVADLAANVDYLFFNGELPQPEFIVGDLNCDYTINVADLSYFVDYLFLFGPIPCGNPYK